MTIGVGLFGTIAAFLANVFIKPPDDNEYVAEIKTLRAEQSRSYDELESEIEGLKSPLGKAVKNFRS